MKLFREGLLIPEQKVPTFSEYFNDFWNEEKSEYLKWKALHEPLAYSSIVTLKTMFGEAVRKKVIKVNPCSEVKDLKEEEFIRDIFTVDEVRKLFYLNKSPSYFHHIRSYYTFTEKHVHFFKIIYPYKKIDQAFY